VGYEGDSNQLKISNYQCKIIIELLIFNFDLVIAN
jgi:hypothetical protein